jgi:hypothetical protein
MNPAEFQVSIRGQASKTRGRSIFMLTAPPPRATSALFEAQLRALLNGSCANYLMTCHTSLKLSPIMSPAFLSAE